VRVRVPVVGGGFGGKKVTRDMAAALAISRKLNRPVRVIAKAEESFQIAVRNAMSFKARVGVDAEGGLVAIDVDFLVDAGAYFTGGRTAARNAAIAMWGCYRFPHYRAVARSAYTNKTPATPHRGTGKTQSTFVIETMIDDVARQLGKDPVEYRKRHVIGLG